MSVKRRLGVGAGEGAGAGAGVGAGVGVGVGVGVNFLTFLKTFTDSEKKNKKNYMNKIAGNLILS